MLQILLAEDSEDDADFITRALKKVRSDVEVTRVDSPSALKEALENGRWDLVLSDYTMPNFSGMTALQIVKDSQPELPFILVTGSLGDETAVAALSAGVDDYVLKTSLARLPATVERQLAMAADRQSRRRVELALRESEKRFRQLAKHLDAFFYLCDAEFTVIYYASPAYEKIWNRTLESLYSNPRSWADAVHPDDRAVFHEIKAKVATVNERRYRIVLPDGAVRWVRSKGFPIRDEAGGVYRVAGIVEDDTERVAAELRIRRLNRIHAVLSGINSLMVRVKTKEELFREACRIAYEAGQLRMAWIGIYDQASSTVIPQACHGHEEGFIDLMSLSLSDQRPEGHGLVRRALRDKRPVIINNMREDSKFRLRDAALTRGYQSGAVFPLMVRDNVIGVLGLFSGDENFFDEEEARLLLELAGDISFSLDHLEKSEKLDYLAYYDSLTGLANRAHLIDRLSQYLDAAKASNTKLALVISDPQRLRAVNESLGRQAGDLLLAQFAERLRRNLGDTQVARIGGDQFAIALPGVASGLDALRTLGRLEKECFGEPFIIAGEELRISASVGIALFPNDGPDAEALLRNAEAALQRCKKSGQRYLFFQHEMTERVAENLTLESRLRLALERDEFVLFYQPKIDAINGQIKSLEALIRWRSKEGLVPPAKFIPLLEETGLILQVGAWALRRAIFEHRGWLEQGLAAPRVAVNVSAGQLRQIDFVTTVRRALDQGTVPPGIDLEITESMVMDDVMGSIEKLRAIRDLGVNIAIDDFGTGYSSLAYLAKLPVSSLKIDRSFVITMLSDLNAMNVVSTIISLAHALKLKVVAEGVDQEDQATALRALGCDEFQGYLYYKPLPSEEVVQLLRQRE